MVSMIYLVCTAFVLARHEMWFDEMQAWQLARQAHSIAGLLASKRYEGHPDAWYVLLFVVSRVSRSPAAMQAAQLALATSAAYVVARWAPFSRATRVLLLCGYYLAYEYAVISRSYVMGVLALFGLCALCATPTRWAARPIATAALLALLGNTSVYGLLLAGAMGLALLTDVVTQSATRQELARRRWQTAAAVVLGICATLWSIHSALPPRDAAFVGHPVAAELPVGRHILWWRVWYSIAAVWRGIFPSTLAAISSMVTGAAPAIHAGVIGLSLSGMLVTIALLVVRGRPAAVVMYVAGTIAILSFTYCCFIGSVRHEGHLDLLLVASVWLAQGVRPPDEWTRLDRIGMRCLRVVFAGQVLLGAHSIWDDVRYPFSTGREAARFIADHNWRDRVIVASPRTAAVVVAGYLDRPVFSPEMRRDITYADWGESERQGDLGAVLDSLAHASSSEIVFATIYPLWVGRSDLKIQQVVQFDQPVVTQERFIIYLVSRSAQPASP